MPQAKTLKDNEIKQVLKIVSIGRNSERNRAMILISYLAGMRVGEIAALKIGDVLTANNEIKSEVWLKPEQTKGSKGRRVIFGEKLRKELRIYLNSLKKSDAQLPLIYSQRNRNGFNANNLGQEFKRIYEKSNISGATSHSGRRTFITNLANKGIGVRLLQVLAGHKSMATTQMYIDVNDDMLRVAVDLI
jgi:integrase/recombinase XerD